MFALHYAHAYYGDVAAKRPVGLQFPGESREPDYGISSISRWWWA
jgi:uncharacterized membrane protein